MLGDFGNFQPGQFPSAEWLNAVKAAVEAQAKLHLETPLELLQAGDGIPPLGRLNLPQKFRAKLLGSRGRANAWVAVVPGPGGTWVQLPGAPGGTHTPLERPAYDANGAPNLPAGVVVTLEEGYYNPTAEKPGKPLIAQEYVFDLGGAIASGACVQVMTDFCPGTGQVQRQLLCPTIGFTLGPPVCTVNPTDCCPANGVIDGGSPDCSEACPGVNIPQILHGTIASGSDCPAFDGVTFDLYNYTLGGSTDCTWCGYAVPACPYPFEGADLRLYICITLQVCDDGQGNLVACWVLISGGPSCSGVSVQQLADPCVRPLSLSFPGAQLRDSGAGWMDAEGNTPCCGQAGSSDCGTGTITIVE